MMLLKPSRADRVDSFSAFLLAAAVLYVLARSL